MIVGAGLGLRAIQRDRTMVVFTAVALAAVLGPLLVLLGLKNGVVGALLQTLRNDSRSLEIVFRGQSTITPAQYARIDALPGVGFLMPDIGSITASARFAADERSPLVSGQAWPTAAGDPLLPEGTPTPGLDEAILSAGLARRLGVEAGARILVLRERQSEAGAEDRLVIPVRVAGVAPTSAVAGERALLAWETIDALQAFIDGYAVPRYGVGGRDPAERPPGYVRIRLFASDLEAVGPLAAAMEAMDFAVTSRADEVSGVLKLDRDLATLFTLIASIGASGYLVSFWASLSASLAQRRRELSLVRLMGGSGGDLVAFALVQGIAIAIAGVVLAFSIFGLLALLINLRFAVEIAGAGPACFLTGLDILVAAAGSTLVVILVTAGLARFLVRIAPSEVLHEA
ncbi:ABC transporter permease [Salinarimonas chemoclinalis]|uniref:ABC transporter permease n=1 Tax=Salinarimonas chemoclinalis TaxID=3241599 RepID=UPI0035592F10